MLYCNTAKKIRNIQYESISTMTSSLAAAAEGHKTAGNTSLSTALDALRNGTPGADKQLSRPARST